jgi:coenzyme F420-reducing hydrogenase alpha subunit
MKSRTIKVDPLARVEGEGSLIVHMDGDTIHDIQLKIFEPPRFFEAFLRDRSFMEAPDITARICGICPVAYQMSSVQAMEQALNVSVSDGVRDLRRLMYCGEWIESHALHIYLLHAPDFVEMQDALQLARQSPEIVRRGLEIKKIGNEIMTIVGGREIHPINTRVGGFYKIPPLQELNPLKEKLQWARDASLETIRWVATLPFPSFERDYVFVALRDKKNYPMNDGRIVSSAGLDIAVNEYEQFFTEEHVEHSNALHSVLKGVGAYSVGPLARYNLNFDMLSPLAKEAAHNAGLGETCRNPFKSIIVRAVEMLYACEESLRIIESYHPPQIAFTPARPGEGTGAGCTEAPRGILYHRYRLNERGLIMDARIVPPTSQNQKTIEADLREYVTLHIRDPIGRLTWGCEQAIRNYDPCISCATHFLKLEIQEGGVYGQDKRSPAVPQ